MSVSAQQIEMIRQVSDALGDLKNEVVFVGGCVTGLLVKDDFSLEKVRFTDDVDLIVDVITHTDWQHLQKQLREKGFKEDMTDNLICRMYLANLKVDVMPVEEKILGFSNQWYKSAIKNPLMYNLDKKFTVKIISPVYFIAAKIDAYIGRGQGDILGSHDLEDMVTLFDGRAEIVEEVLSSAADVRAYISSQLKQLMDKNNFEYVIQSVAGNNQQREQVIFERINRCIHHS
ncbi:MAG: hypothetical protein KDI92_15680 [Xanthomonadales bacterium]|nr:hypothetical protein [Xanthomonadales bacterium]